MPTDPYIAPDPDARPRQQQNLPPGVALPPANRWTPNRPGDLGAEQPTGELLGRPGPNVGYAYSLVQRAKDRLRVGAHEHIDDIVPVLAEIAGKRAASYGRAPVMPDVDRAIALLGYDGTASEDFVDARARLVHEAGHSYPRRRAIVDAVSDEILRGKETAATGVIGQWRSTFLAGAASELPEPSPS